MVRKLMEIKKYQQDNFDSLPNLAFGLWLKISLKLLIIITIAIFVFIESIKINYIKANFSFLILFITTIISSIIVINKEFSKIAINLNKKLHPFFSIAWRETILSVPAIFIIAYFSKGDILGRFICIMTQLLLLYPAIVLYLNKIFKQY